MTRPLPSPASLLTSLASRASRASASRTSLGLLLGLVLLVPGCSFAEMTVELAWGSSFQTCASAGVVSIDYDLYDSTGLVTRGRNVSCGDLVFSSIAQDNYSLEVYGYDRNGNETYAATCAGIYFEGSDITHRCTVPASGDPLQVSVTWDLDQTSGFVGGSCAAAGVVDYDYLLRDASGVVASEVEVLCSGSGNLQLDFGIVPTGNYVLEMTGYADDGIAYWFGDCSVFPGASVARCNVRDDP